MEMLQFLVNNVFNEKKKKVLVSSIREGILTMARTGVTFFTNLCLATTLYCYCSL